MISPIDPQFNRAYLSVKDMARSVEFASAAGCAVEPIVQRALITAAIVSYVRPFSGNRHHGQAVARLPFSLRSLSANERKLHEKLCEIRNKAIAHTDFEMNPSRPIEYQHTGFLVASRIYDPLAESLNIRAIHALAEKVKANFETKMFELARVAASSKKSGS